MFNLNDFRGMSLAQLRAKYVEVRTAVLATEKGSKSFGTAKAFDDFLRHYVQETKGIRVGRDWLMCAFNQLHSIHAKRIAIPPSQETLSWGGFLGGEVYFDTEEADAICRQLLNS